MDKYVDGIRFATPNERTPCQSIVYVQIPPWSNQTKQSNATINKITSQAINICLPDREIDFHHAEFGTMLTEALPTRKKQQ